MEEIKFGGRSFGGFGKMNTRPICISKVLGSNFEFDEFPGT